MYALEREKEKIHMDLAGNRSWDLPITSLASSMAALAVVTRLVSALLPWAKCGVSRSVC